MMGILSIQSHVVYGYVGNKAATYPLQVMGFDVWPIHTVQFSNHTGYGVWEGEIFSAEHISKLADGLLRLGCAEHCLAILTGYMGSADICCAVSKIVKKFKEINQNIIYLCDPVIGNQHCCVQSEVLDFFKHNLCADIITPNQYEAEILSGMIIHEPANLNSISSHFHHLGIQIVVITGVKFSTQSGFHIFASNGQNGYLLPIPEYGLTTPVSGTGDLFSSTFLGSYLKHKNMALAVQYAAQCLQLAIEHTHCTTRELNVLSVPYGAIDPLLLPNIPAVFSH